MATLLVMPKLGLTMKEGTVGRWYKEVGDEVKKGDVLYDVETDKLTNEVESRDNGILRAILVQEGEKVPCMTGVGIIAGADEDISALLPGDAKADAVKESDVKQETAKPEAAAAPAGGSVIASPAAKKLAKEKGLDISRVTGTGPGGRITIDDVESFVPEKAESAAKTEGTPKASPTAVKMAEDLGVDLKGIPSEGRIMKADVRAAYEQRETGASEETVPMNTMRKVIARRMSESWNTCPTVTFDLGVDITAIRELREKLKKENIQVSYTDILAFITARTLREFPKVNSSVDGESIIYKRYVNLGVAVALPDGLLVPVIRDADRKGLETISKELHVLAVDAKAGRLSPDDFSGGTFTITNLGMFGIERFSPIINLPEVAILGVNAIRDQVVVEDGNIVVKPIMNLSLTADHRVVDGAVAAEFLARLKKKLENPALLLV